MNEAELKRLAREIANNLGYDDVYAIALKHLTNVDFRARSDKLKVSLSEGVTKENISELAKMTAKQIYTQGYVAGELVTQTETWNAAIEKAASEIENFEFELAEKIRSLKK